MQSVLVSQSEVVDIKKWMELKSVLSFLTLSTMVRDRLAELCANKRNDCKSFLPEISQKLSNKKVKDVLDEAEKIRDMVSILQENINIVKDLHNNVLSHTDLGIQNELESRTFIISQTAFRIRTSLKELGKDVSSVDELTLESARDGPVYMRIKFLQYATILRMFSDIMHAYNESLLRYHDKCSSLLHQQRILRMFLLSKQMVFCFGERAKDGG
ncbi:Similar to Syx1A: Syntaxin-1A (Drosophila melanogaster) [Cotesia congregata]|uniref:Similar to Syx1A: Syntaxin-1A (Drosophila melanogaster) n=1 Tax=Cotesia congregata TaxID=51543 RepID=A0A8J2H9A8_COTCN|nr:Similar to Syx1A: Syntaxin-1A (Drosophila melanogaster) [Cotesia congregata]